jgi:hypothetical protein
MGGFRGGRFGGLLGVRLAKSAPVAKGKPVNIPASAVELAATQWPSEKSTDVLGRVFFSS